MRDQAASSRRASYADGVIAAAAAFMADAEHLGALADAEAVGSGDGDGRMVCTSCQMRRLGFAGLADRLEFAIGVSRRGAA